MAGKLVDIHAALEEAGFEETGSLRGRGVTSVSKDAAVHRIGLKEYLTDSSGKSVYTVMDSKLRDSEKRLAFGYFVGAFATGILLGYLFCKQTRQNK